MLLKKKKEDSAEGLFNTSIIARSLKLTGDMESEKNIRIDGRVEGTVRCKAKVIIGKDGFLNGSITTQDAEVSGTVYGQINVFGCLEVKNGANIQGEIYTNNIVTEQGAKINGSFSMMKEENRVQDLSPKIKEINEKVTEINKKNEKESQ